jgi:hypothetical protein
MESGGLIMNPMHTIMLSIITFSCVSAANAEAATPTQKTISSGGQITVSNPLATVSVSDMASFLNRPLFSPSRRPPVLSRKLVEVAPPPPTAPVPVADHLHLIGTLNTTTGLSALIQNTKDGMTVSASTGQVLDGWKVVEIGASTVQIEQKATVFTLEIFRTGKKRSVDSSLLSKNATELTSSSSSATKEQIPARSESSSKVPTTAVAQERAVTATGTPPPGTVLGTAAAKAVANSDFALTFGAPPAPKGKQ